MQTSYFIRVFEKVFLGFIQSDWLANFVKRPHWLWEWALGVVSGFQFVIFFFITWTIIKIFIIRSAILIQNSRNLNIWEAVYASCSSPFNTAALMHLCVHCLNEWISHATSWHEQCQLLTQFYYNLYILHLYSSGKIILTFDKRLGIVIYFKVLLRYCI